MDLRARFAHFVGRLGKLGGLRAEIEIVVAWEEEIGFGFTATTPDEFEPEARRRAMGYAAEALGGAPSVSVSIAVHRGRPAGVLVEASHGADLLVVGSPGHSALADLVLGSVSEHCVRHADCPVVVVREPT
jgi:nucleotide-binding universal stress UspA family protein